MPASLVVLRGCLVSGVSAIKVFGKSMCSGVISCVASSLRSLPCGAGLSVRRAVCESFGACGLAVNLATQAGVCGVAIRGCGARS